MRVVVLRGTRLGPTGRSIDGLVRLFFCRVNVFNARSHNQLRLCLSFELGLQGFLEFSVQHNSAFQANNACRAAPRFCTTQCVYVHVYVEAHLLFCLSAASALSSWADFTSSSHGSASSSARLLS